MDSPDTKRIRLFNEQRVEQKVDGSSEHVCPILCVSESGRVGISAKQ